MWYEMVVFNGWKQIFSEGNGLMGENQKMVWCILGTCQANIFTVMVWYTLGFGARATNHIARYVLEHF